MGTSYTPVFDIPYPDRDATLCEAPAQLRAMAQGIDDALTTVEVDLPRFINPPFARLSSRVSYTLAMNYDDGLLLSTANLIFDSVDVDTANMANLSLSDAGIYGSRDGYYEVGVYVHLGASNAASPGINYFRLDLVYNPDVVADNGSGIDTGDLTWDGGVGSTDSYLTSVQEIKFQNHNPATPGPMFLAQLTKVGTFSGSHKSDQVVAFSVAWAKWLRDL